VQYTDCKSFRGVITNISQPDKLWTADGYLLATNISTLNSTAYFPTDITYEEIKKLKSK
jgi:hypothetical protein